MVFSTKRRPVEEDDDTDNFDEFGSLDLNDDSDTSDEEKESEDGDDDDDDDEDSNEEKKDVLIYEDDEEELEFEDDDADEEEEEEEEGESDGSESDKINKKLNTSLKPSKSKKLNKNKKEKKKNVSKSEEALKADGKVVKSGVVVAGSNNAGTEEKKEGEDEYEEDSSDEEDARNTVGDVPKEWYKHYDHVGYGLDGLKIMKEGQMEDELDNFISRMDDPNYWRTVRDKWTGAKVVLSDDDIKLIRKYLRGKYTENSINQTPEFEEPFVQDTMHHPLTNHPEDKRAYGPSKWEKLKIGQLVHSMKMGWMKVRDVTKKKDDEEEEEEDEEEIQKKFYALWSENDELESRRRIRQHIAAPKMALPGHAESYNPPPEYLLTPQEEEKWQSTEPSERRSNFLPQKFASLRSVPGYARFVSERFERCLDLYLCPRKLKMRANVKAEDLLPKLPSPRDLQPFPTTQALIYKGHTDAVRCLSFHPSGELFASGSEDGSVRVWEVVSGRCVRVVEVGGPVKDLQWNPNHKLTLLAAAVGSKVLVLNSLIGTQVHHSDNFISNTVQPTPEEGAESKVPVTWEDVEGGGENNGIRLIINHPKEVSRVCWQSRGDYMAVVLHEGLSLSVLLHRISSRTTMNPFSKPKGMVQCVCFHPTKPILYVATQQYVRVYHLVKQLLTSKLMPNCKWISSISVHPWGDNVIVGSYDSKLAWFDTQLSDKPYQTLKHHKGAIRQVCYHKSLPLFASCSDDASTIVCHGKVYSDLNTNALIVPVKVLRGHVRTKGLGVLACQFHPSLPWIVTAGADHTIRLYA